MNHIDEFKDKIQEHLGKEITEVSLKGRGMCNNIYRIETKDGSKYVLKQEREDKEAQEQNNLVVEGKLLQKLNALGVSTLIPKVVFISEDPKMFAYEYIEGETMKSVWGSLIEEDRINICRSIGHFHGETAQQFTKEMCVEAGLQIDESKELHPEVVARYTKLMDDKSIPQEFRDLLQRAKDIYEELVDQTIFHFIHNDGHHENILIKGRDVSGIVDFGDAEWGDVAEEFSRYIRDYPDYFKHIVSGYEEKTGDTLSLQRLVSKSYITNFTDIVKSYKKGGDGCVAFESRIAKYKEFLLA